MWLTNVTVSTRPITTVTLAHPKNKKKRTTKRKQKGVTNKQKTKERKKSENCKYSMFNFAFNALALHELFESHSHGKTVVTLGEKETGHLAHNGEQKNRTPDCAWSHCSSRGSCLGIWLCCFHPHCNYGHFPFTVSSLGKRAALVRILCIQSWIQSAAWRCFSTAAWTSDGRRPGRCHNEVINYTFIC